ncbi:MAG: hypothetical protein N2578_07080, partial [Bdellovibrionaceae bacterium]|nr:hypothetical protein [Pseudobdellovibrionaceae bacterium]
MRQRLAVLSVFIFAGCQTTPSREPASFDPSYDSRKVRLLQLAATSGILINIQDAVLRDPPKAEINESCRGTLAVSYTHL